MNSFTEENYLKTIYKLWEQTEMDVSTNDIAEKLNTKAASVTDMLKKLAEKKLIHYQKYKGVSLTTQGKKLALYIIRKHRLWEVFLVEKLNFKWDEVHDVAEQLEHIDSEKLIEQIDKFLGYPKFDPHGDPIPDVNGKLNLAKSQPLALLKVKIPAIMTGVVDHTPSFLQYLDKLQIALGDEIKVKEIVDYDKSLRITTSKHNDFYISHDVAKNILVSIK